MYVHGRKQEKKEKIQTQKKYMLYNLMLRRFWIEQLICDDRNQNSVCLPVWG
jgi:hypothetical protein